MLLSPSCAQLTISWNATRVTGPRRTADGVPDGRIASPVPVWASHDRLFIAIGARGMPHRDLTRRLLPLPIIHATSSVLSVSSVSSVPLHPCQTRFQWPRAAPVPCARLALQSPQADAARGAAPPHPLRDYEYARLHDRFRQLDFTIGFVSSRSVSSARAHARPTAASLTRPSYSHSAPSAVTRPSHYSSHRYGWHRLQRRAYSPQPARPQS